MTDEEKKLYSERTLAYYDKVAASYAETTVGANMSGQQRFFLRELPLGDKIIDLGCGSGRDSRAFLSLGYDVLAVDGSRALCAEAAKLIGSDRVICTTFADCALPRCWQEGVSGIWACASLLHVKREDLASVIRTWASVLLPEGVFYMSFKYGDFSGYRGERYYADWREKSFAKMMRELSELEVEKIGISSDVLPGRGREWWLNVILKKRGETRCSIIHLCF